MRAHTLFPPLRKSPEVCHRASLRHQPQIKRYKQDVHKVQDEIELEVDKAQSLADLACHLHGLGQAVSRLLISGNMSQEESRYLQQI